MKALTFQKSCIWISLAAHTHTTGNLLVLHDMQGYSIHAVSFVFCCSGLEMAACEIIAPAV